MNCILTIRVLINSCFGQFVFWSIRVLINSCFGTILACKREIKAFSVHFKDPNPYQRHPKKFGTTEAKDGGGLTFLSENACDRGQVTGLDLFCIRNFEAFLSGFKLLFYRL